MAETDGPIKQADVIMLNYPLNWNYSADIMKNDLEFYELMMSDRTPAMTWSWFTIGWKWVNEYSKMTAYFLKSYQDYTIEPFKVMIYIYLLSVIVSFICALHIVVAIDVAKCVKKTDMRKILKLI